MRRSGLSFSARSEGSPCQSSVCPFACSLLVYAPVPSDGRHGRHLCLLCPRSAPLAGCLCSLLGRGFCLQWLSLTATIAAELEQALLASMTDEESQPTGPPPASKYAVKHLQKETLTEERLRQLGASDGVQCAVCRLASGPRPVSGRGTGLQACPHITSCHVGLHELSLPRFTLSVCSSHI